MGSYSGLMLGPLTVTESKNEFVSYHNEFFLAEDLVVSPLYGQTEPEEHYERPLRLVVKRLELMGFTLARAREEYVRPNPYSFDDPLPLTFDQVMDILRTVNIAEIKNEYPEQPACGQFVPADIQPILREVLPPGRFEATHWDLLALLENFSPESTLRVLAESPANLDLPVIWFFNDVVQGGWTERENIQHGISEPAEYLLVTEGSSDAKILRRAFDVLRPDISDFFRFVDMADGYPFSGTGNLLNFAKGLVSIRIQNNVVFVFDNDAEGVACMKKCNALSLPPNMKMMKLPDIEEFRQFRTVGPQGDQLADINGRGASIECYLDLPADAAVRWSSYNEALAVYQGALMEKDRFKREFLDLDGFQESYNYEKLNRVLDEIVAICTRSTV
ncbi:HEPN/Toprim-associated domain-containing protein [Massilia solisilvae]|uniref:HEPN/Toprim-associated domain-containing protein n=1 Tax=Massilia solisilvae TaxID=1811225 RepID=A0ABT2BE96_9BURK|nr:HEPN/Toprim-associated domain-containing protein [Massilia solisilvae]MCS0606712.1 HEPN/Toprim-associated domain-containing protein [Massilia solisilvae]